ncbi:MAG: DUF2155 domain-containing protein [Alphaproteobacteria bacterium]|nr:DUF2155 domain-containing protein [Alphaproteobacteria bacterium]
MAAALGLALGAGLAAAQQPAPAQPPPRPQFRLVPVQPAPGSQPPAESGAPWRPAPSAAGPETEGESQPRLETWLAGQGAEIQALDKVTARISTLSLALDQPVRFGTIEVLARACFSRPPDEVPEHAAFLQVLDHRRPEGEPPRQIFSGWMFASSPALSSLEHAVYDLRVLRCK